MVNCAVITCKNRSTTSNPKENGVSYYMFPKNSPLRDQWIKFCGQNKSWHPTKASVICSEHFTSDSFDNNMNSLKLIDYAVPTLKFFPSKGKFKNKAFITITNSPTNVKTSSITKDIEMTELDATACSLLRVCRICLVNGQKMYEMQSINLSMHYNVMTGLNLTNDEDYPQMLCWECVQRLKNWVKFRKKALRSHDLMTDLLQLADRLTNENLSSIDREKNELTSQLEIQTIDIHMIEEAGIAIVHKPVIDPLSDFVYDDDDAISLTDTDDEEFLNEYKEILRLEKMENEKKESKPIVKDDMNEEVKVEFVKSEQINDVFNDDVFNDENNSDEFDNDGFVDDAKIDKVNKEIKVEMDILDNSNDSMDAKLSELKTEKRAVGKMKKQAKPSLKKNLKSKGIQKKAMKKEKTTKARVPRMSRKERSETYFDKNLIEVVNVKIEDAIAMVEKRKETENFKDADYKCLECFKGFYDKDVFDTHLEYHSLKRGEFQCHVCKVRFPKKLSVKKHLNNHLLNYCCKLCGFTTKSRIGAKRHSDYHKKGTLYKCPHCDHKFVKHTSYLGHLRKKHPSDIVCVLCGCSFVSEKGLDHHKKLKHRFDDREVKDDGPLCEDCNVRFVSEEALTMHNMQRHNKNDGKPDVHVRHRGTTEEREENKDKKRDKRRPPYKPKKKFKNPLKCEQCGLELSTIRAYYWHFRKEHPDKTRTQYFLGNNKFMCEVCGRFFQKADVLEDHISTHTGLKVYKCDRCGKEFNTNLSLTLHLKIHDVRRKKHSCSVCGKMFLRSNNLKRHEYLHTGLRPFACDLCGKCFPTNSERKTHIQHAHFKKPWPKRNRAKENGEGRRRQIVSDASMEMAQPLWGPGSESTGDDEDAHANKMYMYI